MRQDTKPIVYAFFLGADQLPVDSGLLMRLRERLQAHRPRNRPALGTPLRVRLWCSPKKTRPKPSPTTRSDGCADRSRPVHRRSITCNSFAWLIRYSALNRAFCPGASVCVRATTPVVLPIAGLRRGGELAGDGDLLVGADRRRFEHLQRHRRAARFSTSTKAADALGAVADEAGAGGLLRHGQVLHARTCSSRPKETARSALRSPVRQTERPTTCAPRTSCRLPSGHAVRPRHLGDEPRARVRLRDQVLN